MSLETLLQAAEWLELRAQTGAREGEEKSEKPEPCGINGDSEEVTSDASESQKVEERELKQSLSPSSSQQSEEEKDGKRRSGGYGTREVHNKLEKNRRAHLKECFEVLKRHIPNMEDKKTSNLCILRSALRYIQALKRKEKEYEHEMERLAREKIATQQRIAQLKMELREELDNQEKPPPWTQDDDQASTSTASEGEDNMKINEDEEEKLWHPTALTSSVGGATASVPMDVCTTLLPTKDTPSYTILKKPALQPYTIIKETSPFRVLKKDHVTASSTTATENAPSTASKQTSAGSPILPPKKANVSYTIFKEVLPSHTVVGKTTAPYTVVKETTSSYSLVRGTAPYTVISKTTIPSVTIKEPSPLYNHVKAATVPYTIIKDGTEAATAATATKRVSFSVVTEVKPTTQAVPNVIGKEKPIAASSAASSAAGPPSILRQGALQPVFVNKESTMAFQTLPQPPVEVRVALAPAPEVRMQTMVKELTANQPVTKATSLPNKAVKKTTAVGIQATPEELLERKPQEDEPPRRPGPSMASIAIQASLPSEPTKPEHLSRPSMNHTAVQAFHPSQFHVVAAHDARTEHGLHPAVSIPHLGTSHSGIGHPSLPPTQPSIANLTRMTPITLASLYNTPTVTYTTPITITPYISPTMTLTSLRPHAVPHGSLHSFIPPTIIPTQLGGTAAAAIPLSITTQRLPMSAPLLPATIARMALPANSLSSHISPVTMTTRFSPVPVSANVHPAVHPAMAKPPGQAVAGQTMAAISVPAPVLTVASFVAPTHTVTTTKNL
ncbi:nascent polypeptide-associated complex subunit alpha, muscle-specific form-like [Branchiostoma floridae]|uniref:Max-binding protein MNT n=1 Tax=Branchiostoma floridae TaxID=7739 RepID=A0A9J7LYT1_BRAFL|nr:nascent polypeptide-associated complex subunit alpha, muscle-specific form-like [Branchiostoma floridae]